MFIFQPNRDWYTARNYIFLFAVGSVSYTVIELLFRGYTHFSMVILGGLCGIVLYEIDHRLSHTSVFLRALCGALAITSLELIWGCILNLWLGLDVWDYTDQPFHLLGQICPLFSLCWFLLCFPAFFILRLAKRYVLDTLHGGFFFRHL